MKKVTVLVVEDESIVAKDIQFSLKKLGYEICGHADNGEKAIELAGAKKPDIVLMDIMLKGKMSGIEAAEHIRSKHDIPIIYLTAYADENTLSKAKVTEPYGYIIKPFKEIDLHSSIEMAIFKHQKESRIRKERDMLYSLVDSKETKGFIFVKAKSRLVRIKTSDIYFIEALKDYVVINTANARYTVHSTMKDILDKLPEEHFVRVHRSYIVRLDKILEIDQPNLVLEDHKKIIPIGGSYKEELVKRINLV